MFLVHSLKKKKENKFHFNTITFFFIFEKTNIESLTITDTTFFNFFAFSIKNNAYTPWATSDETSTSSF